MDQTTSTLAELLARVPRRHSPDNIKEIYAILSEYENVLMQIEALNSYYEKNTAPFFDHLEEVRSSVKKSGDNKASKKNKEDLFAEGSGTLKESIESLLQVYGDGTKTS